MKIGCRSFKVGYVSEGRVEASTFSNSGSRALARVRPALTTSFSKFAMQATRACSSTGRALAKQVSHLQTGVTLLSHQGDVQKVRDRAVHLLYVAGSGARDCLRGEVRNAGCNASTDVKLGGAIRGECRRRECRPATLRLTDDNYLVG